MALFLVVHLVFVGGWTLGVAGAAASTTGADGDFWRDLALGRSLAATLLAGVLAVHQRRARHARAATPPRRWAIWFGYLVAVEAILAAQVKATIPWFLTLERRRVLRLGAAVASNGHSLTAGARGAPTSCSYVVRHRGRRRSSCSGRRDVT